MNPKSIYRARMLFSASLMCAVIFLVLAATGFILQKSLESETSNARMISRAWQSEYVRSLVAQAYVASFNAMFGFLVDRPEPLPIQQAGEPPPPEKGLPVADNAAQASSYLEGFNKN